MERTSPVAGGGLLVSSLLRPEPFDKCLVGRKLGSGCSGKVSSYNLNGRKVALKRTKALVQAESLLGAQGFLPGSTLVLEAPPHPALSELVIGSMIGRLKEEGRCANFLSFHGFFALEEGEGTLSLRFLMDRVRGSLDDQRRSVSRLGVNIFVQTMFAVASYQKELKVSHNDLHPGNVLLERVTKDTSFGGEDLAGADWYRYDLGGKEIFLPATPVIAKIGDFGSSVKFSEPVVGLENASGREGPPVPDSFLPSYDSAFAAACFEELFECCLDPEEFVASRKLTNQLLLPGMTDVASNRPHLEMLREAPSAEEALRGGAFQERYGTRPKTGRIVTLGTL